MTFTTVDYIPSLYFRMSYKQSMYWTLVEKLFGQSYLGHTQVLYVIFEGQNKVKKTFGIRPWLPENKKEQLFLLLYFSIFYILEMKNQLYKKSKYDILNKGNRAKPQIPLIYEWMKGSAPISKAILEFLHEQGKFLDYNNIILFFCSTYWISFRCNSMWLLFIYIRSSFFKK